MENFRIASIPALVFGAPAPETCVELLSERGFSSVLLLTGAASFTSSVHWDRLQKLLQEAAITFYHSSVPGEPSPDLIDTLVGEFRANPPDAVISIGGGSTIDSGKAVSAMLKAAKPVSTYLEGVGTETPPGGTVPFIAVPTTSGTGSEATKNAVISQVGDGGFKKSLRHDDYIPDFALLDPDLLLGCPPNVTAASGMDAVTQLLEAFVSTKANPITDGYAAVGLELAGKALPAVCSDQSRDRDARGSMAIAAYNSGVCLANAGLGIVHGIAGALGGLFAAPHGAVCGTLLAPATETITEKLVRTAGPNHPAYRKYGAAARYLSGHKGGVDEKSVQILIDLLWTWTEMFSLPRLSTFGIDEADVTKIVEKAGLKNTPVDLSDEEIHSIIIKRL